MKLDWPSKLPAAIGHLPSPGDILSARGGSPTVAWLCVAINERRGVYLGLDSDGNIVSGATYNNYAMKDRSRLGRVELPETLQVVR